jgi:hypothetical protein
MRIATFSKRAAAVATVGVLALGLVACGDDGGDDEPSGGDDTTSESTDTSPSEPATSETTEAAWADQDGSALIADVKSSMDSVKSLRIEGTVSEDGEETTVNLALNTDGNCEGTIGIKGGHAQMISVDGNDYIKGDDAFWLASLEGDQATADQITTLLGDRWAKVPKDGGSEGFSEVCDLDSFLDDFLDDTDDSSLTVGAEGEVDGAPTVELLGENALNGEKTTAVVGSGDDHFIYSLTAEGGDSPGEVNFSEFNEPVKAEAPAPEDVLDLG